MAITKRMRYEILRRDGHRCRSCGATAEQSALHIDHVKPTALGGADEAENLQTLCAECNAGKSSAVPDAEYVAEVEDRARQWGDAMRAAAEIHGRKVAMHDAELDAIDATWKDWHYIDRDGKQTGEIPRPADWRRTADLYLTRGLPLDQMIRLVATAMDARTTKRMDFPEWSYYIGCVKNVLTEVEGTARELLAAREEAIPRPEPAAVREVFAEPTLDDLP